MIPTIYNEVMTDANHEYSKTLPNGAKVVLIQLRGDADLKLAYIEGESGTKYITIPAGDSKVLEGEWVSNLTLYFQSPSAAQVAEIEWWG